MTNIMSPRTLKVVRISATSKHSSFMYLAVKNNKMSLVEDSSFKEIFSPPQFSIIMAVRVASRLSEI